MKLSLPVDEMLCPELAEPQAVSNILNSWRDKRNELVFSGQKSVQGHCIVSTEKVKKDICFDTLVELHSYREGESGRVDEYCALEEMLE
jgi:hypothetical protein